MVHVADGVIHPAADQPLAARLVSLFRQITEVLERFQPDEAAVEETFVNRNPASTLKLGVARGVVSITEGAWYQPDPTGLDRGGNPNLVNLDRPSACGATTYNSCLVEVEAFGNRDHADPD